MRVHVREVPFDFYWGGGGLEFYLFIFFFFFKKFQGRILPEKNIQDGKFYCTYCIIYNKKDRAASRVKKKYTGPKHLPVPPPPPPPPSHKNQMVAPKAKVVTLFFRELTFEMPPRLIQNMCGFFFFFFFFFLIYLFVFVPF